ncbi:hypothetical protein DFH08DRAFT_672027, partial [Mycena albidolilacea]
EEVATVLADEIRGKNVLITGTSLNGIGFETARVVAKYANLVITTGHNAERLNLAEGAIKNDILTANIRPLILDLSSLSAPLRLPSNILIAIHRHPTQILIHNAAATIGQFKLIADKLETQMATNHIGPFLLTKLLTPKILAAHTEHYTPRVVFVSSVGHSMTAGIDFDTLARPDATRYVPKDAYNQSKAANVLSTIELSKRSKGKINGYSLHPG